MINFLAPGTQVQTKQGGLKATIVQVAVKGEQCQAIEYQLAWITKGSRNTTWVNDFEVEPTNEKTEKTVGFTQKESNNGTFGKGTISGENEII